MSRRQTKSRATYVAGDAKKRRLRMLIKVCVVLLLPTLYFFYSLSGLYIMDVELTNLKKQILWCVLHPLQYIFFVDEGQIVSKDWSGKMMGIFFYTSDWKLVSFNGQEPNPKFRN